MTSRWLKVVFLVPVLGICTLSCGVSFQKIQFKEANRDLEQKKYPQAIQTFKRLMIRAPESQLALEGARRGARASLFEAKDFLAAVDFYRHLVLYSPDGNERVEAQKSLASVYFENLANFEKAIDEYNKLLVLPLPPEQKFLFRFNIAKAYFNLNLFDQAQNEINDLLTGQLNPNQRFDVLLFKGNLQTTNKKPLEAIETYRSLMADFPDRSVQENVAVNLAMCFEESADFSKAIEVLKSIRDRYPTPDFIDLRIKRLQERQANMPGAKGLRR